MRLFTIGYERRTPDELVERLRAAGVQRLVDVRELPLSRRRGFSRTPLAAALAAAGIRYEHVRALGNPKAIRDRFKGGDLEPYRAHLLGQAAPALAELAGSLAAAPTCLLCVEAEPERCHRGVIAVALAERLPGLEVVDL